MTQERLTCISKVGEWDVKTCSLQIEIRRKLIDGMVGQLYPAILRSEIEKIYDRKKELQCFIHNG